jgi:hypothetical protein
LCTGGPRENVKRGENGGRHGRESRRSSVHGTRGRSDAMRA